MCMHYIIWQILKQSHSARGTVNTCFMDFVDQDNPAVPSSRHLDPVLTCLGEKFEPPYIYMYIYEIIFSKRGLWGDVLYYS